MSRKPAVGVHALERTRRNRARGGHGPRWARCLWGALYLLGTPWGCQRDASLGDASPSEADSRAADSETAVQHDDPRAPAGDPFASIEPLRPRAWATWPLENVDLAGFDGWRIDPVHGGFELEHGLVLASDPGAFVLAIADGEVVEVTPINSAGAEPRAFELHLDHGQGVESHVGPVSDTLVHAGLSVTRGAAIALAAGKSLRLRVTVDGLDIDPLLALRQPIHRWPGQLRRLPPPPPE